MLSAQLCRLLDDENFISSEADLAGPWRLASTDRGFALLRDWERLEDDLKPEAVFSEEPLALLAAAAFPSVSREALFHLRTSPDDSDAFPIETLFGERGVQTVGWLRLYNPDFLAALQVLATVARSPLALANLLQAAGGTAVGHAVRIIENRKGPQP